LSMSIFFPSQVTGFQFQRTEVEIVALCSTSQASLPTASTCFEKLRLPRHYATYKIFHQDLCACISTSYSGFGCP
uniref:HECT domain-containing protein n=1 Tax=Scophthalmus maximus TaxID=52904 RepID=A0A8D2ZWB8_SCOMX